MWKCIGIAKSNVGVVNWKDMKFWKILLKKRYIMPGPFEPWEVACDDVEDKVGYIDTLKLTEIASKQVYNGVYIREFTS